MQTIYFDNASTTFPKPKIVADTVYDYMTQNGCNIGRGCYQNAYQILDRVFECREQLCQLFGGDNCRNVVFTKNITESLNFLLKGLLKSGDHVLVSSMEHNAIMRPLQQLTSHGISFSRIPCRIDGTLVTDNLERYVKPETRLVVMTHASNVCGTVMPIEEIGRFCQKHNLLFFVDCAQTAGCLDINMKKMHIDALAFTGHKGLLGPQGIGGFLLREGLAEQINPLISGGTGSISHSEELPSFMPDRFEAGTMNIPGILGLNAALQWLKETGIACIQEHELLLTEHFLRGITPLEEENKIRIIGKKDTKNRTGVVSIQTPTLDLSDVAYRLDEEHGIQTRVGLHCAPNAHKILDTYPCGTIRFSFGWWNTPEQIDTTIHALEEICHGF